MDRVSRHSLYALLFAGVLALVMLAMMMKQFTDLGPEKVIDSHNEDQFAELADAEDYADPFLTRAEASVLPGAPPDLARNQLRIRVLDPLDLLATPHELCASGPGDLVCRRWRREEDFLFGDWPDEVEAPVVVEFILDPLRPARLVAASAVLEPDPAGGWSATLNLADSLALVELVVTGAERLEDQYTLKAGFYTSSEQGTLDMSYSLREPLIVVAPVPCTILSELNGQNDPPQYAQRTLFPIVVGGRHRLEVSAASGSVRVRVHELSGPQSLPSANFHLELIPELARGGFLTQRITGGNSTSDALFTLVPPGRYTLTCYEEQPAARALIGSRAVAVGAGESLVEFRSPQDVRTLTVYHTAPPGTTLLLQRAGVPFDFNRRAVTVENLDSVRFEGLDADEWIVVSRNPEGMACARADTRFSHHAEATLGAYVPLASVQLEMPEEMSGVFEIRAVESSGRMLTSRIQGQLRVSGQLKVAPGILEVLVLHHTGLVAGATVLVPPSASAADPLRVPLNFHLP